MTSWMSSPSIYCTTVLELFEDVVLLRDALKFRPVLALGLVTRMEVVPMRLRKDELN